ncbi:MAG: Arabinose metabolism transcriptional repressor [Lentisphaerae bacterium ADurb.Bin242]|nr:MAG: Arabinose metabolism transcriptional repressor [Lentisphaerae bacterium ADurb.Bin242]
MEKLEQILSTLKKELGEGKFAPGTRFPSEYDLAQRFSVNKKTANKAVSLLAAEGFLTRGKRGQGTRVAASVPYPKGQIAFLGSVLNAYYAEVFHGIQCGALQRNYMTYYFAPPPQELNSALKKLFRSPAQGIITHAYGHLEMDSLPCVYIDYEPRPDDSVLHMITCNNYLGGHEMMKEILARGHRDIVIYFHHGLMSDRLRGFHDAMKEAGIKDCRERTFCGVEHSDFDAREVLKAIRKKYPACSVIATASDNDLLHLVRAMKAMKIPWRDDFTVTGFGNVTGISTVLPVATVDQHPFRIGCRAADLLINIIENGEPAVPIRESIGVEVINAHNIPVIR